MLKACAIAHQHQRRERTSIGRIMGVSMAAVVMPIVAITSFALSGDDKKAE